MKTMMIAMGLAAVATLASAQTAPQTAPQAAPQATPQGQPAEAPVLPGAVVDSTCGSLYDLAGKAFCVTAPLASIGDVATAYVTHFEGQGWIAVAGDDNRVVFVKRRDDGACDGLQLQAFYNTNRPASPDAPGYVAMATIPGNLCAAAPAAPVTPQ